MYVGYNSYGSCISYVSYMSFLWIAWNHSKIAWIILNIIFSVFKSFSKIFHKYIRMEDRSYKNKIVERKCIKNMWKNYF